MISDSLLIKKNQKLEKSNLKIIKDVFFKLDNLDKDNLSNFLIFKEALNWKSILWSILNKNFDMDDIDEFFFYIDNLGENFQIKDFIPQRLYSAHLN